MTLTKQQEEVMLQNYTKLIWNVVHKFKRRSSTKLDNEEDLFQECALVFLKHIRSAQSVEQIMVFPFKDMVRAMCNYILGEQTLSYPRRTSDFSKKIHSAPERMSFDACFYIQSPQNSEENAIEQTMVDEFLKMQDPCNQQIFAYKKQGLSNVEIAEILSLPPVNIHRRIKRMKDAYSKYAS